jgi:hypothetical protein
MLPCSPNLAVVGRHDEQRIVGAAREPIHEAADLGVGESDLAVVERPQDAEVGLRGNLAEERRLRPRSTRAPEWTTRCAAGASFP